MNSWLLGGDPLTLIDPGPCNDEALASLEGGLRQHGVRVEDIELVLATHHHIDHAGLAATVSRRSGARVAAVGELADYCAEFAPRIAAERAFSCDLMLAHGVPEDLVPNSAKVWDFIAENGETFHTHQRLGDGGRVRAGNRVLTVISRPGHSATDTLFVDAEARIAFVGDHLLAGISSNTEVNPERPLSRAQYLDGLRDTAATPLVKLYTGHGAPVTRHASLIGKRLAEHADRCVRVTDILSAGPASAFEIARHLWSADIVQKQALFVIWEVLGHLEILRSSGVVIEERDEAGRTSFALADSYPRGRASAS